MIFNELTGKTLISISGAESESVAIYFKDSEGHRYRLSHYQDCCELVEVVDVCGDIADLIGLPLLLAEEVSNGDTPKDILKTPYEDSYTWTFYKLATNRGAVTIRWLGQSNGYYSEQVDFEMLPETSTEE